MALITKTIALAGALFAASGFATPAKKCAIVWETVTDSAWDILGVSTGQATAASLQVDTTTASEMTLTATVAAHTLQEGDATLSTSVITPAPTEQATATSVEPIVQGASSFASSSSSSTTRSGYNGAYSKGSPCTGDITYYDTATTTSNPSFCGTTNDGRTDLVLALPHGIMTDSDCGKSVPIACNGVTKTGTVVDKGMGCDNTSVDLSRAFFQALAGSLDAGRISDVKFLNSL